MKKLISVLVLALALAGCATRQETTSNAFLEPDIPDSIKAALEKTPVDVLCGIGSAKTESDGEAILLAEDRAREHIAIQLDNSVTETKREDENGTGAVEIITESRAVTTVYNAQVVLREKDKNGNWWCLVWAPKNQSEYLKPITDDIFEILRSNAAELTALTELKREIIRDLEIRETVTVYENTSSIPGWVFNYSDKPEDVLVGLGAAKLDNDKDSIQLAKERARRSLAHSLGVQVTSVYYAFEADNTELYEELHTSVTSVFDHSAIPTLLYRYTKTKDGTWWVMLGVVVTPIYN